jgi:hypothetical protein
MRATRRAVRDQVTKPNTEPLPDAFGDTITRRPVEPIGLLEILERAAHGASRGGAVSGAAQSVTEGIGSRSLAERGIALSDGSRICFASIADTRLFHEDDGPESLARPTGDSKTMATNVATPLATADKKAPAAGRHRARLLVSA